MERNKVGKYWEKNFGWKKIDMERFRERNKRERERDTEEVSGLEISYSPEFRNSVHVRTRASC